MACPHLGTPLFPLPPLLPTPGQAPRGRVENMGSDWELNVLRTDSKVSPEAAADPVLLSQNQILKHGIWKPHHQWAQDRIHLRPWEWRNGHSSWRSREI
ncbi:hypothetical protein chiPu_0020499 [Chiloscyllium punctatum]|uniref:Uncharacterized protein n=1 Tax=Chiloscyllium punctatum TaxID=137246 RepID=A0A401RGC5_CHIPU|nr:hypothetical protein [Chiloscyllium punctatum]